MSTGINEKRKETAYHLKQNGKNLTAGRDNDLHTMARALVKAGDNDAGH